MASNTRTAVRERARAGGEGAPEAPAMPVRVREAHKGRVPVQFGHTRRRPGGVAKDRQEHILS